MSDNIGLVWLSDDLRLTDNALLTKAAGECERLIICYFVEPVQLKQTMYGCKPLGMHRQQFLAESLHALNTSLSALGQHVNVFLAPPFDCIEAICAHLPITHIYRSKPVAFNEAQAWLSLRTRIQDIQCIELETRCLFNASQLDFDTLDFSASFSRFRKQAEKIEIAKPLPAPNQMPKALSLAAFNFEQPDIHSWITQESPIARGGEPSALAHINDYFSSDAPNHYKNTRNALDGWSDSSKWSFWLANGSLSVRHTALALRQYQEKHGKNDENDWLMFELLWREYFQWYSRAHNQKLFLLNGISSKKTRGSFYAQRFQQWCNGTTPYPIVNACMLQLNKTGYMSNRGRQIAASALIHELGIDWRAGAAYFEQQLIDYDPASNWGNWQYIAGVGADPRGGRQFNLEKQTKQYDPEGKFIDKWTEKNEHYRLDYVDAADWPIM